MNKPTFRTADCSLSLSTDIGNIEVFGLNEVVDYGNGGPGGFGGHGDHNEMAQMLQSCDTGAEAELTFYQLDLAAERGEFCAREALHLLLDHGQSMDEPLRTEFLAHLPSNPSHSQEIHFYQLYQDILTSHPITVLESCSRSPWNMTFHFDMDLAGRVNWNDWDELPDDLVDATVLCVIEDGIGHVELTFDQLLGWLKLAPGFTPSEMQSELTNLAQRTLFDYHDEYHFGTRAMADKLLFNVSTCLLRAFYTSKPDA